MFTRRTTCRIADDCRFDRSLCCRGACASGRPAERYFSGVTRTIRRWIRTRRAAGDRSARFHGIVRRRLAKVSCSSKWATRLQRCRDGDTARPNHSFPETLCASACWPIGSNFASIGITRSSGREIGGVAETQSGADDLTLGFKIALTEQQGCLPETAIILQMSVPTGGDAFTSDEVLPGVQLSVHLGPQRGVVVRRLDGDQWRQSTTKRAIRVPSSPSRCRWDTRGTRRLAATPSGTCCRRLAPTRTGRELFQRRIHVSHQQRRAMGYPRGRRA